MAKKNKNITNEVEESALVQEETSNEVKAEEKSTQKAEKKDKVAKQKAKKKEKKPLKIVKFFKEMFSELKKVTWPSFKEVAKKTAVVIGFVVLFGLVIFGIDRLLGLLFDTLVSNL